MSDLDVAAERPWTVEAVHQLQELARAKVPASLISSSSSARSRRSKRSSVSSG
jgi:hypothetical protein